MRAACVVLAAVLSGCAVPSPEDFAPPRTVHEICLRNIVSIQEFEARWNLTEARAAAEAANLSYDALATYVSIRVDERAYSLYNETGRAALTTAAAARVCGANEAEADAAGEAACDEVEPALATVAARLAAAANWTAREPYCAAV